MLWQVGRTPIRIKVVMWLLSNSEQENPQALGGRNASNDGHWSW